MEAGWRERMEVNMSDADFIVRKVGEAEENDVYTIAISEDAEPTAESNSILFQWSDDNGPQEVALGWDTYCICEEPGQRTFYGGVKSWGLKGRVLVLRYEE